MNHDACASRDTDVNSCVPPLPPHRVRGILSTALVRKSDLRSHCLVTRSWHRPRPRPRGAALRPAAGPATQHWHVARVAAPCPVHRGPCRRRRVTVTCAAVCRAVPCRAAVCVPCAVPPRAVGLATCREDEARPASGMPTSAARASEL